MSIQDVISELKLKIELNARGSMLVPRTQLRELISELQRLDKLVNSPEIEDFLQGVRLEAAHQRERWGESHDRSKSSENWYFLVGYLGGKALRAVIERKRDKALHHTISSAAALFNWHTAIRGDKSGCGLGEDVDLAALDEATQP